MSDVDAIVIGAGHNGLTAGTMLARDGLKVLCLEKTNWAGGMAATKELFKGYKHSVGAWAMIVLHQEMIDLLDVEKFGFETIVPDTSYCVYGEPEDKCFIAYQRPDHHGEQARRGPRAGRDARALRLLSVHAHLRQGRGQGAAQGAGLDREADRRSRRRRNA